MPEVSIGALSSVNRFIVLTGSAGSGKSMMMRHLFLDTLTAKEKVPIFIELRSLNQKKQSLLELIYETLSSNRFTLDCAYIDKALKAGHFVLLFDGLDEVTPALRRSLSQELQQLLKSNDQNIVVVSSRPDPDFSGWQLFSVVEMLPLTLTQACTLVDKLPFDSELKSKFLKDLRQSLFVKHNSFLSNPLLLSIMLLTYEMSADIPNKISVFYNQAYEALFQRHDASKGGWQRDRSCNLDIQDFAKVFAAFSIQTYDVRAFQFSKSEALQYIEKTKNILHLEFKASDYLEDALEAVCLLVEDGLIINFSHRSFQEYFAARFIADANQQLQQRLISKYSNDNNRRHGDNVIDLLFEINSELVEKYYIIPGLAKLEEVIGFKGRLGIQNYIRLLKSDYKMIGLKDGCLATLSPNKTNFFFGLINFALNHCGELVQWPGYQVGEIRVCASKDCKPTIEPVAKISEKYDHVILSKLKNSDNVFRLLSSGYHVFSMQAVDHALRLKKALIAKHESVDRTLAELFDKK